MISGEIDIKGLGRQISRMAAEFGEANETAIARWGVATCRRLVVPTQSWGDGADAKKKQENAILKDANRAIFAVSKPSVVKALMSGKMSGLVINGELVRFTRAQLLLSPEAINEWIENHRTPQKGRVPRMKASLKGVAAETQLRAALRIRNKRAGKAKGGWIGAGQAIGRFQKSGSRITIGKNVAGYAHKFKSGGSAGMRKSQWNPEGTISNNFPHVANTHVLKQKDMDRAVIDAGKNTITWYEKTMQGRLNKRNR